MKILITGGAGFVGSHLAELLLAQGHEVAALDDLSTGARRNVAHLEADEGFELHRGSVFDGDLLGELVGRAELVVHLAATVGVRRVVEDPVGTIENNVHGTEAVLERAARGSARVVLASTSEVYGKSRRETFREGDDLVLGTSTRSRWSYATSKLLDEFLGFAYQRQRGVPVVVVRLFNTVGPRQSGRYGMVVPRFVAQALAGEPITVYGDGTQTRTFTHVADAVWAMARLALHPDAAGEVFNVGGDEEVSILELARRVRARLGSSSEIRLVPYEEVFDSGFEDMMRRVPDIAKARRWVGYRPRRDLDRIIDDVAAEQSRRREETAAAG